MRGPGRGPARNARARGKHPGLKRRGRKGHARGKHPGLKRPGRNLPVRKAHARGQRPGPKHPGRNLPARNRPGQNRPGQNRPARKRPARNRPEPIKNRGRGKPTSQPSMRAQIAQMSDRSPSMHRFPGGQTARGRHPAPTTSLAPGTPRPNQDGKRARTSSQRSRRRPNRPRLRSSRPRSSQRAMLPGARSCPWAVMPRWQRRAQPNFCQRRPGCAFW